MNKPDSYPRMSGVLLASALIASNTWGLPAIGSGDPVHVSTCPDVDAKIAAAKVKADAERIAKAHAKQARKAAKKGSNE